MNNEGDIKICDFGISAIIEKTFGERQSWVGTLKYMSPERLKG